jgi:predicted ATPase
VAVDGAGGSDVRGGRRARPSRSCLDVPLAPGPECEPKHRARGEWLCSRAYAVLGRAEPALHHAQRCFEICERHADNVEDWDLAFAYEALARANRVAGNEEEARRFEQRGLELADAISDPEDKEIVLKDYATL